MTAIYKRELRSYFQSVIGWLFMAALLFLSGLYFFAINLMFGYGSLADTISSILFLLILAVPILSMRILAEERRQKTDQLILTAPVSIESIVLGKYLSMLTIFTIPVLVMMTYPLILSRFGTVAMRESYTAILMYYLLGAACLAVCLFLSSITESQVIAAVLGFAVLFLGYMMGSICELISSTGNIVTQVLSIFDFYSRLQNAFQGTLSGADVLYFLSIIAVFLFLTVQSIQKRRYQISVHSFKFGAYSSGMIALVLAAAVFLNLAVSQLPERYTTLDMTSQKLYSLTSVTEQVLKNLDQDVTIYVLDSEDGQDATLGQTLRKYADLSGHIQIEYKDPVVSPDFYKNYTDGSVTMNSLIVESGERFRVIDYSDIYETSYDYYSYSSSVTGYDAEGQLTSAIAYVTKEDMPVLYLLEGQDELSLEASFTDGLKKANLDTASLQLLTEDGVPEDAAGVLILAPNKDISSDDADKLIAYLDQGGKLMMTLEYTENFAEDMPNFQRVLDYFGLSVEPGLIVEGNADHYYQTPLYLLPEISYDTLTAGVTDSYIFMPYAMGVRAAETEGVTVTELLSSSEESYTKQEISNMEDLKKAEGDAEGPFLVGLSAEKELDSGSASLILYTSSQLFTEAANNMVGDTNLTLFTNAVSSMAGQTDNISVPVKSYETPVVAVSQSTAFTLAAVLMVILPVGMIAAGLTIWIKRRRR